MKILKVLILILLCAGSDLIAEFDSLAYYEKQLKTGDSQSKVENLLKISQYYENFNLQKSVEYSSQALALAKRNNDFSGTAKSYLVNANQLIRYEKFDSVFAMKELAYNIYKKIGDQKNAAIALLEMARTTLMQHKYTKTNDFVHQALEILDKINDKPGIAFSYMVLGQLNNVLGMNDVALEYFNNAILIYENLGETIQAQHIYVLINLARLLSRDKSALEDLKYSMSVYKKNNKNLDLIEIYRGYADYYYTFEKNYQLASTYLDTAITLSVKMEDNTLHGILLSQYAWMFSLKGDYEKELEYNRKALEVRSKSGYRILYASSYLNIGVSFFHLKQYDSSKIYLLSGLEILGDTNSNHYTKRAFHLLYDLYSTKNDIAKALYYRNKEINVEHAMTAIENQEKINSAKTQIDLFESKRKISELKNEKARNSRILIVSILAGFIVSGVYLYFYLAKTKRRKLRLNKQDDVLNVKNKIYSHSYLSAPGIIYVYDPNEHINSIINDNILNELGYRNSKIHDSDKLFWGIMHKDDEYLFIDVLESNAIHLSDNPIAIEFRLKDYFGDTRYFRSVNKLIGETNEGKTNKILGIAIEVSDYKKYEENQTKQISLVKGINQFFDAVTNVTSPKEIYVKTADKLREITDASLVAISSFNQEDYKLNPQHFSVDNKFFKKLNSVLGMNLDKMIVPVSDQMLIDIKSKNIKVWDDIYESAGGVISKQIAVLLKDMFNVREVLGLSLVYNDVVFGAMTIVMRNTKLQVIPDVLKIYANIASYALYNLKSK